MLANLSLFVLGTISFAAWTYGAFCIGQLVERHRWEDRRERARRRRLAAEAKSKAEIERAVQSLRRAA